MTDVKRQLLNRKSGYVVTAELNIILFEKSVRDVQFWKSPAPRVTSVGPLNRLRFVLFANTYVPNDVTVDGKLTVPVKSH